MKKVIAKEGLVLLSFIFLAVIVYFLGTHTSIQWEQYRVDPPPNKFLISLANGDLSLLIFPIGYFAYLILSFILWAIKTLKG